jgi:hypothetical protein
MPAGSELVFSARLIGMQLEAARVTVQARADPTDGAIHGTEDDTVRLSDPLPVL